MKSVKIKPLYHRGRNCLGLFFPKDFEIISHVKKIPGVRFSATNACWYVPSDDAALGGIIESLQGKVWVDISILKKPQFVPRETNVIGESHVVPAAHSEAEGDGNSWDDNKQRALDLMKRKLKLRNYSPLTQKTYTEQFRSFLRFFPDSHPEELGEEEIRHYLLYLIETKKFSTSSQNQAINAIKFYYEKVLGQNKKVYYLERPMKETRLPEVLSQQEVMAIFEATDNLKHRVMLMLLYASGLRRGELLQLRIGDADFNRQVVFIRGGKGRKDRQSVLAKSLVPFIERYLEKFRPKFWLFEGIAGDRYSSTSLQQVLKKAVAKAGIKKHVRLHMLRHSFATHLLEQGTSTRYIQVLLGHESSKTTELYAQVTQFGLDKVVSPLDQMANTKLLRDEAE